MDKNIMEETNNPMLDYKSEVLSQDLRGLNFTPTKEQVSRIKEMVELQWELNDFLVPNWTQSLTELDFEFASLVEIGEAGASLAYKWWKKEEEDLENFKVELIDILHFKMSALYYTKSPVLDKQLDVCYLFNKGLSLGADSRYKIKNNPEYSEDDIKNIVRLELQKSLISMQKVDVIASFYALGRCFGLIGETFNSIGKDYITKLTLNKFRKNNGYVDGTYIKLWKSEEISKLVNNSEEVEDNVVAFTIQKSLKLNDKFSDDLYKKLTYYYSTIKKG